MPSESQLITPIIAAEARCIGCGYSLRELTANRCPECARGFDPHDPLSMNTRQYRQRLRTASWVPAVLFGATFVSLFFLLQHIPRRFGINYPFSFAERLDTMLWIVAAFIASWLLRARARRAILGTIPDASCASEKWGRRLVAVAALLIIVVGTGGARSWECPHGRSVKVGPLVLTRYADRGPCKNYCSVRGSQRLWGNTFISIADE
jgi:hypothetical protein